MTAIDQSAVWRKQAQQWQKVGPPLRPCAEDNAAMIKMVFPVLNERNTPCEVAILGVTPEIVQLPWPHHVMIRAFDHSAPMIAAIWQPHFQVPSSVTLARWQELPVPSKSIRIAVGDASFAALPSLADYPDVLAELARILESDGRLCVRMFLRSDRPESRQAIADDAKNGRIGSFHVLKWRLALTLGHAPDYSVAVQEILEAFESTFPDRIELAKMTEWPLEVINTIDAYRGASSRLNFPTMQALKEVFAPFFELADIIVPNYEIGANCPTLHWRFSDSTPGRHP